VQLYAHEHRIYTPFLLIQIRVRWRELQGLLAEMVSHNHYRVYTVQMEIIRAEMMICVTGLLDVSVTPLRLITLFRLFQ